MIIQVILFNKNYPTSRDGEKLLKLLYFSLYSSSENYLVIAHFTDYNNNIINASDLDVHIK